MKLKSKKYKVFFTLMISIIGIILFCFWQNNDIVITNIIYSNVKISDAFNDYKIVQISDLHNKEFGSKQKRLLEKLRKTQPNMIVITGDLIDSKDTNLDIAMEFINDAVEIAPVYYVSGNHEAWSGIYDEFKQDLLESGVSVLDNSKTKILMGESNFQLLGISDPAFFLSDYLDDSNQYKVGEKLKSLVDDNSSSLKILLSHRPELIDIYAENNIDLVFTGHAHGGQFRIPFIGGLAAPDQGLFPKYTSGIYHKGNTTEIVSRGLGNSVIPVRIFNRPEIIVVTLKKE